MEDILLGWAIGLCVGLAALKYVDRVAAGWGRFPYTSQIAIAVAASVVLWPATVAINGCRVDGQPRAFLAYAATISGIIMARGSPP